MPFNTPHLVVPDLGAGDLVLKDPTPTLSIAPGPCSRITGTRTRHIFPLGVPHVIVEEYDVWFSSAVTGGSPPRLSSTYQGTRRVTFDSDPPTLETGYIDILGHWAPTSIGGITNQFFWAVGSSFVDAELYPQALSSFTITVNQVDCRRCLFSAHIASGPATGTAVDVDLTLTARFNPTSSPPGGTLGWPHPTPTGC